jgi:small subunit ribosomal protein S6
LRTKVQKRFGHLKKKNCNFAPHFALLGQKWPIYLNNSLFYILNFSMNQYETVFILTPVLSDDQMKETVAKFKNLLTEKGAEILNEETWGLKKMAYAIQKKSTGFYCLLEFKAEPSVILSLETGFRRDEKVIRFITVKLDKYAAAYAEKRRNKLSKKEEA